MKATLTIEYNPEDSEDVAHIDLMRNAARWRRVVDEVDSYLRNLLKHETLSEEVYDALDKTRDLLWDVRKAEGLFSD